jgi:hypothetical protein
MEEENQGRIVNDKLEKMRKEMGIEKGAGAFFRNDKRPSFDSEKLGNVLRLLTLGEKVINLKETEFRAFIEGIFYLG